MAIESRNVKELPTTASFRITIGQKAWIEKESERQKIKQSHLVRKVLDRAIADAESDERKVEAA